MIPYIDGHLSSSRGAAAYRRGQPIHMFGLLVAIGVIVGDRIVVKQGQAAGSTRTTSST